MLYICLVFYKKLIPAKKKIAKLFFLKTSPSTKTDLLQF